MIEPNVCLVSTKLDFVNIFTDFCDAKMWVYDRFRFGPEKETFQRLLFFFLKKPDFLKGLAFFCITFEKCTGVFL